MFEGFHPQSGFPISPSTSEKLLDLNRQETNIFNKSYLKRRTRATWLPSLWLRDLLKNKLKLHNHNYSKDPVFSHLTHEDRTAY